MIIKLCKSKLKAKTKSKQSRLIEICRGRVDIPVDPNIPFITTGFAVIGEESFIICGVDYGVQDK